MMNEVADALNILDLASYRNSCGVGPSGPAPSAPFCKRDQGTSYSNVFCSGRAIEKTFEWPQLIDNFNLNFLEVGESAEKLAVLRVKKQLSMRQLSKETGHSLSYLRQQLREFGIAQEKSDQGLQPYGWRMVDRKLVPVENEQQVICEIIAHAASGESSVDISRDLNKRAVPSKTGGKWWPSAIRRILARERKRTTSFAKVNPS
jgi:hypothetical protein